MKEPLLLNPAPPHIVIRYEVQLSMQQVIDAALESFKAAIAFLDALPIFGFMLVRGRLEKEFISWGMSKSIAAWLAWQLPYPLAARMIMVLRHDRRRYVK